MWNAGPEGPYAFGTHQYYWALEGARSVPSHVVLVYTWGEAPG